MVDVVSKLCEHLGCTRRPSFNVRDCKTTIYCNQHAKSGTVDVHNKRCSYGSCATRPNFSFEGCKPVAYCKKHAEAGMVNVFSPRCSHEACTSNPWFGELVSGAATVCGRHVRDRLSSTGVTINFRAHCNVAGCSRVSRWGLAEKQPTHCSGHGSLEDGLEWTVRTAGSKRVSLVS